MQFTRAISDFPYHCKRTNLATHTQQACRSDLGVIAAWSRQSGLVASLNPAGKQGSVQVPEVLSMRA